MSVHSKHIGRSVAAALVVLSGVTAVPPPVIAAPAVHGERFSAAGPLRQEGSLIGLAGWNRHENGNSSSRCEHSGQSYVAMDFNAGQPRPRYDIIVRLLTQPPSYFDSWQTYVQTPSVWQSEVLYGPGSPGREGYFNLPTRHVHDDIYGTIGVEVLRPATDERVGWQVWDATLACGYDYGFWFTDQV